MLRIFHWLKRLRHRCGYGIHSPFAFGFVTGVVYERGRYYAYDRLRRLYGTRRSAACMRWKDYKLLFRLTNFVHPHDVMLFADDASLARDVVAAACPHAVLSEAPERADMIISLTDWTASAPALLARLRPGGMLVLHRIDATPQRRAAWRSLLAAEPCVVAFDLRDFGIVFFRPELQRERFVINYF